MVTLPPPLSDPPAVLPIPALGDKIGGGGKLIISPFVLFDCYVNPLVQLQISRLESLVVRSSKIAESLSSRLVNRL